MAIRAAQTTSLFQGEVSSYYSGHADWMDTRSWYRDSQVVNVIKSLLPAQPKRVLELCCGSGLLLETLASTFPKTEFVGVDISSRMAELARDRVRNLSNVTIANADWIYSLGPEAQQKFDVILVKNALHVLPNLHKKLTNLKSVTGPLTRLIVVETVSPNELAHKFVTQLFQFTDTTAIKQAFFTRKSLEEAIKNAGWDVQRSKMEIRQHIDVADWLGRKCPAPAQLAAANSFLAGVKNQALRRTMDFDSPIGSPPSQLLRLQYVAAHFLRSRRVEIVPGEAMRNATIGLPLLAEP